MRSSTRTDEVQADVMLESVAGAWMSDPLGTL
jgi:hypothetical protein